MTKSFFVKSWQRDLPWLEYLKRSVRKFAPTFFDEIVLLLPVGVEFEWLEARIERCRDLDPGYLGQMAFKCYADSLCRSELVVFGDSDTIITRELREEDFIKDGKPIWIHTPFVNAREDQKSAWLKPMEDFIGKPPASECMRRHCFAWPRAFFDRLRSFCKFRHRMELVDYIMSKAVPGSPSALVWSEFNCGGAFAMEHERDMFTWVEDKNAGPAYVHQGHTWAGPDRMNSDIEQFKRILGEEPQQEGPDYKDETVTGTELQVIWNKSQEINVTKALEMLAKEASQSPGHKGRLIRKFNSVMATVKPKMAKMPEGFGKGRKATKDSSVKDQVSPRPDTNSSSPSVKGGSGSNAPQDGSFILAVQTYPGANDTLQRHAPFFERAGASRIVAITTTDGKCAVPKGWEEVQIGKDSYIDGDVLPRRVLHILEWFVTQPEHLLCCAEYDNILRPIKPWAGMMLAPAGGKLPDSKASTFFHTPWLIDRESAKEMIPNMQEIIAVGITGPEASPDVFLSYAVDRSGPLGFRLAYKPFEMFTRNTIGPEDLEDARQAYRKGLHIHGCKDANTLKYITS